MFLRTGALATGLIAAFLVAGCGGSGSKDEWLDASEPSWSPDSSKIVFTAAKVVFTAGTQASLPTTLYVVDSDGGSLRRVKSVESWAASPSWAANGTDIAFVKQTGNQSGLFVVHSDGSELRKLKTGAIDSPAWSPDGTQIAFAANRRVFVIARDGSGVRAISRHAGSDPAWSPDGERVVFSSGGAHSGEIFEASIADGHAHRLFAPPHGRIDMNPAWSPDGTAIAVERVSCGESDPSYDTCRNSTLERAFVILRRSGARGEWVRVGAHEGGAPAWSPDGKQIAFVEREGTVSVINAHNLNAPWRVLTPTPDETLPIGPDDTLP